MTDLPDLPALDADAAALVAAYPLPDGVTDALVNKAQVAHALGVSEVTVSAWMRKGLPVESEGTNGRSYTFRLSVAYAWVQDTRKRETADRARAEESANQLALALSGGQVGTTGNGLTPKEQRDILEIVARRNAIAREVGDLIQRDEALELFERAFATIRDGLDALPDRLGRELMLEGRDLEVIERACDDALRLAAGLVEEIARNDDNGPGLHG